MGYLPRRAANGKWNKSKRDSTLQSAKLKGAGD